MKLGISSYTYSWAVGIPGHLPERLVRPVDLLEKASALGVRVVQIADNMPLHLLPAAELEMIAEHAQDLGLDIELGTRGISPAHLHTYLHLARQLKSSILRVIVDTAESHPTRAEIVRTITSFCAEFEQSGVVLAIENHDRFTAQTLASIVKQINSDYVGVCLDTVNSFGALEGPDVVVSTLGPKVANLHIKDFEVFRASHQMGFLIEGRPAGQGQLNVPWLLETLHSFGQDPNAIVELWTPPARTLNETVAREDAWAAESVLYLRKFIQN